MNWLQEFRYGSNMRAKEVFREFILLHVGFYSQPSAAYTARRLGPLYEHTEVIEFIRYYIRGSIPVLLSRHPL